MRCCRNLFPAVWYAIVGICFLQSDALLSEFVSCSLIRHCRNLFPAVWYAVVGICFLQSDTLLSEFVSCSLIRRCQNLFPAVWYAVVGICLLQSDTSSEFVSCSLIRRCQNLFPAVWYVVVGICFLQSDTRLHKAVHCPCNELATACSGMKEVSWPFISLSTYLVYYETIMIWTSCVSAFSFHKLRRLSFVQRLLKAHRCPDSPSLVTAIQSVECFGSF